MNKLKPLIVNLGLVLGSLIVGVIISEIGLRIAGIENLPPPEADSDILAYTVRDPYRGWSGKPNAVTVWAGEGERSGVRMNNAGMRDRDRTIAKPENTFRIAFLGDSFVEALHVPLEKTAASIMEKNLASCPALKGKTVEVLNFGVQGYGTAQELMTLRHHVWQFSPDLVMLGFYPGNDVRNNYRPLEHDHLRPYFTYQDGKLIEDLSFRNLNPNSPERDYYGFSNLDHLPYPILVHSRVLQLIRKAEIESKRRQFKKDYEQIDIGFYKEPPNEDWQEAWNVTEGLITLMRDEVQQKGVDFRVVTISDSFQVNPDAKKREEFMKKYNIQDLFYPDKRIEALGKREGFPVFRLAEPLRQEAEKKQECLHGFENAIPCEGHWNIEGNRIAAELMAKDVCQYVQSQQQKR